MTTGSDGAQTELRVAAATPEEMYSLGSDLAAVIEAGDLIILDGPLGAGKTLLTRGIGAGLGVAGRVVSPTFVIARVHRGGRIPLVHVDAYRLGSLAEVDDMDLDVAVADSVTVVEWGTGLVEQLSEARLQVRIERLPDSEVRTVTLRPVGGDWDVRLRPLTDAGLFG